MEMHKPYAEPQIHKTAMTFKHAPTKLSRPNFSPPIVCSRRLYIQLTLILAVAAIVMIVWVLSNMRVVFVHFHNESDTDGELVILPEGYAAARGAFCLDGSPPAFYLRHGEISGDNNWLIYLPPGAWCTTVEDCYERSFTDLGSSRSASTSTQLNGILSSDEKINPDFYSWNMAKLLYCDGSSYTGNKSEVVMVKQRPLYMRGGVVFEALIDYLLTHTRLATAHQVILVGSSAGGLAALIQADRLREKLPSLVKTLHVLADGALFLDVPDVTGRHNMANMLHDTYSLHNLKDSWVLKECTRGAPVSDQWRCLLPEVYHRHVFTPVFFVNSLYDTWYAKATLNIFCSEFGNCQASDLRVLNRVKQAILQRTEKILASGKNGIFITSCPVHTLLHNYRFGEVKAGKLTSKEAISMWLQHKKERYNITESVQLKDAALSCRSK